MDEAITQHLFNCMDMHAHTDIDTVAAKGRNFIPRLLGGLKAHQ